MQAFETEQNLQNQVIYIFLDVLQQQEITSILQQPHPFEQSQQNLSEYSRFIPSSASISMNLDSSQVGEGEEEDQLCMRLDKNRMYLEEDLEDTLSDHSKESQGATQSQRQNIVKNILKSFVKYMSSLKNKQEQLQYVALYNSFSHIPYSEIKKAVQKKIKDKNTRWNCKLKSIIESVRLSPLLLHYLLHNSAEWLLHSKVSNVEKHQDEINQMIRYLSQGDDYSLITYRKK